jgi:hypothetical protein
MAVDPFAAAQVAGSAGTAAATSTATAAAEDAGNFAGAYDEVEGSSLLFGEGAAAPALFNKTHFLGTERSGIITKTADKQDRDFNAKAPKFWSESRVGGEKKNGAITTDPIDAPTGKPNRKVMVTHVTLATGYKMEQQEALAAGRDANFGDTDDGTRVEVVGGFDIKIFKEAIQDANRRGLNIRGPKDLEGKKLTVKRAGQKQNPGGNPSWIKEYRLDNA